MNKFQIRSCHLIRHNKLCHLLQLEIGEGRNSRFSRIVIGTFHIKAEVAPFSIFFLMDGRGDEVEMETPSLPFSGWRGILRVRLNGKSNTYALSNLYVCLLSSNLH